MAGYVLPGTLMSLKTEGMFLFSSKPRACFFVSAVAYLGRFFSSAHAHTLLTFGVTTNVCRVRFLSFSSAFFFVKSFRLS